MQQGGFFAGRPESSGRRSSVPPPPPEPLIWRPAAPRRAQRSTGMFGQPQRLHPQQSSLVQPVRQQPPIASSSPASQRAAPASLAAEPFASNIIHRLEDIHEQRFPRLGAAAQPPVSQQHQHQHQQSPVADSRHRRPEVFLAVQGTPRRPQAIRVPRGLAADNDDDGDDGDGDDEDNDDYDEDTSAGDDDRGISAPRSRQFGQSSRGFGGLAGIRWPGVAEVLPPPPPNFNPFAPSALTDNPEALVADFPGPPRYAESVTFSSPLPPPRSRRPAEVQDAEESLIWSRLPNHEMRAFAASPAAPKPAFKRKIRSDAETVFRGDIGGDENEDSDDRRPRKRLARSHSVTSSSELEASDDDDDDVVMGGNEGEPETAASSEEPPPNRQQQQQNMPQARVDGKRSHSHNAAPIDSPEQPRKRAKVATLWQESPAPPQPGSRQRSRTRRPGRFSAPTDPRPPELDESPGAPAVEVDMTPRRRRRSTRLSALLRQEFGPESASGPDSEDEGLEQQATVAAGRKRRANSMHEEIGADFFLGSPDRAQQQKKRVRLTAPVFPARQAVELDSSSELRSAQVPCSPILGAHSAAASLQRLSSESRWPDGPSTPRRSNRVPDDGQDAGEQEEEEEEEEDGAVGINIADKLRKFRSSATSSARAISAPPPQPPPQPPQPRRQQQWEPPQPSSAEPSPASATTAPVSTTTAAADGGDLSNYPSYRPPRESVFPNRKKPSQQHEQPQQQQSRPQKQLPQQPQAQPAAVSASSKHDMVELRRKWAPIVARRVAGKSYTEICRMFYPNSRLGSRPEPDAIRRTLRRALARYHPDKSNRLPTPDERAEAAEIFVVLQQAYEELSNYCQQQG